MSRQKGVVPTKKQNFIQGIKFVVFSISAGVIQAGTLTLLNEFTSSPPWLSYLSGLVLSVLYNFTLNRRFTFKSAANVPVAMLKVAAYYAVFTPLSTLGVKYFAPEGAPKPVTYIVSAAAMLTNLVTEFLFYRFVVYRNSMYTNKSGKEEMQRIKSEQVESNEQP
ncbi:MAG: GtrA family protein [Acutalibacteraceae bacterium]|jgi:putative flippase GtrA